MNIKLENQRKYHRINFDEKVNLDFMGDRYDRCQIKNLSLNGMFVTGIFQQQQKSCHIHLISKVNDKDFEIFVEGKVAWANARGVALNFTSMKHSNYNILKNILIYKAEKPSILLKEFPILCPFETTR